MSTISSQLPTLASTLLQLTSQARPSGTPDADGPDADLADTLNLSNSSIADLEAQAQEIASQNRSSVLTTSEQAFQANLAAVAALSGNPAQAQAAQGGQDAASVLNLVNGA